MKSVLSSVVRALASYWLCSLLLFLLLVLTILGTLAQVDHGIYEVQQKYFNSLFLIHELPGGIPLPLPGVYLISFILIVNIVLGAILRAQKSWRRPGMLIAHGGIIFLLLSGFVTFHYSVNGHMTLYEGETSSTFESYTAWSLTIAEVGEGASGSQLTIPEADFDDMAYSETRTFQSDSLPFDLTLHHYMKNCRPRVASESDRDSIDGVVLEAAPLEQDVGMNFRGASVTVIDKDTGEKQENRVWGASRVPWLTTVNGREYAIQLRHKQYGVPFQLHLDEFIRELHPGTRMAASFESVVTLTESTGGERQIEVEMNSPLRYEGYTFYQASWGPENAPAGTPLFSSFAVVKNPADQWPKYATYVITIGLTLHFFQLLLHYLKVEQRRQSHA